MSMNFIATVILAASSVVTQRFDAVYNDEYIVKDIPKASNGSYDIRVSEADSAASVDEVSWDKVVDTPDTLADYGITNGATKSELESGLSATNDFLRTSGGTVSGNVTMNGDVTINAPVSVNAQLIVDGNATLVSKAHIYGGMDVIGDVSVSGEHALSDYGITDARALTNNVCAADSFCEWEFSDGEKRSFYQIMNNLFATDKDWDPTSPPLDWVYYGYADSTLSVIGAIYKGETQTPTGITATRSRVATSNELFVTQSFVTNAVNAAKFTPSAADPAFSNAVLAVQINTNLVAQIGELNEWIGDYGGMGATSLGGLIAALLAAVAWLKKKTALLENDGKASNDFATDLLGKPVAKDAISYSKVPASDNATNRSIKVYSAASLPASIPLPEIPSTGIVDLEVWIETADSVPAVTFSRTVYPKDGKALEFAKNSTNIVHLTAVGGASYYTAVAAAFAAETSTQT